MAGDFNVNFGAFIEVSGVSNLEHWSREGDHGKWFIEKPVFHILLASLKLRRHSSELFIEKFERIFGARRQYLAMSGKYIVMLATKISLNLKTTVFYFFHGVNSMPMQKESDSSSWLGT